MVTIISNKCGGKSSGCCVELELPYGIAPNKISDNTTQPGQAGTKPKPKNGK